ncbi:MAG: hypothetical protein P1U67_01035 [Alcanivoracaceae bacterium]|nr:hypothetical protein [Alcanivoracaceae bacterium]
MSLYFSRKNWKTASTFPNAEKNAFYQADKDVRAMKLSVFHACVQDAEK